MFVLFVGWIEFGGGIDWGICFWVYFVCLLSVGLWV